MGLRIYRRYCDVIVVYLAGFLITSRELFIISASHELFIISETLFPTFTI